ncbi:MAG: S8 family serine peptidase [Actinomycetota bacterium]|nr:S8 family serine peptidase [Actinomycetota bacterium]
MRRFLAAASVGALTLAMGVPAGAAPSRLPIDHAQAGDDAIERELPEWVDELKLDSPISMEEVVPAGKLERSLMTAEGPQAVVVRLTEEPVADVAAEGADVAEQQAQLEVVKQQQQQLLGQASALQAEAEVLGTTQKALNAVILQMEAGLLRELAADPAVVSISPVVDYRLELPETVPYIGATAVHELGFTGEGMRIAVLDTGVDYTHAHLGGPGSVEAYQAAYGTDPSSPANKDPDDTFQGELLFPNEKVVGGFDFVGESWPFGPLFPDPDPIDFGGHGTHVADIAAGLGGVAPGAEVYAIKVCSSVSPSCSGVALMRAMDLAVDPNGDGATDDHVDIINMSLGAPYGQAFYDDLSQAVENASAIGVLTVASAGNGSDKPYKAGSPAVAPSAISVAQTQVPSAVLPLMEIVSPPHIAGFYAAVHQPWSAPLTEVIEAPVQYGDGAGGNLLGCEPFAPGSLSGLIVLVDRGDCFFSTKIRNIQEGGGLIGIIGLVAPGEPFEGGFGGGDPITIPGYMISQEDSNAIKSGLDDGVVARFDPDEGIPLVGHMVGSSSRGPTMLTNIIKPEIGAPGGSISAVVGSGDQVEAFSGTSGAAPMVSGSAALVWDAFPGRSRAEIKAVLVNTAETDIMNEPEFFGGDLAPISRIGGGEVRVDRAVASPAAAWEAESSEPALSFRFHDITQATTQLTRTVTVRNYSDRAITYQITPVFRFAEDQANGAVQVQAPASVQVGANGQASFDVQLIIDGTALRDWGLNSGSLGASGDTLSIFEYDGYLLLDDTATAEDDESPLHVPWHVLPRLAGDVTAASETVEIDGEAFGFPAGQTTLGNHGVGTARIDAYSLIGTSANLPDAGRGENSAIIDLKSVGVATFPVPPGFCSPVDSFVMAFAVHTWERQTHANAPAAFAFDLDVDQDGTFDYQVFNLDLARDLSDGRNVTFVVDLGTRQATAFFFTDHGTNSGNTVLLFCGEQIGMSARNFFQQMDVRVLAVDIYFTGNITDSISGITIAPLGERYFAIFGDDGFGSGDIPPNSEQTLTVLDFGPERTNPSETGLLLLLDASRPGNIRGGAPPDNEAIDINVVP